jgi:hypothetical protein
MKQNLTENQTAAKPGTSGPAQDRMIFEQYYRFAQRCGMAETTHGNQKE